MWIMLNRAFWSVSAVPREQLDLDSDRTLQVRTRTKLHANLVNAHLVGLGFERREVNQLVGADYEYRVYVTPAELVAVLAAEVDRVNYTKFKPTVRDEKLHGLYLRLWAAIAYALSTPQKLRSLGLSERLIVGRGSR